MVLVSRVDFLNMAFLDGFNLPAMSTNVNIRFYLPSLSGMKVPISSYKYRLKCWDGWQEIFVSSPSFDLCVDSLSPSRRLHLAGYPASLPSSSLSTSSYLPFSLPEV